jgi:hypothetical protein
LGFESPKQQQHLLPNSPSLIHTPIRMFWAIALRLILEFIHTTIYPEPRPISPRWSSSLKSSLRMHPFRDLTLTYTYSLPLDTGKAWESTTAPPMLKAPGASRSQGPRTPKYTLRHPWKIYQSNAHLVLSDVVEGNLSKCHMLYTTVTLAIHGLYLSTWWLSLILIEYLALSESDWLESHPIFSSLRRDFR